MVRHEQIRAFGLTQILSFPLQQFVFNLYVINFGREVFKMHKLIPNFTEHKPRCLLGGFDTLFC